MQDRLQLPESLEKAFEYAKELPPDHQLGIKRATQWEKVTVKGQRAFFWARMKPLIVLGVAGVAVASAFLVPLPFGGDRGKPSVEVNIQNMDKPVQRDDTAVFLEQKRRQYKEQGFDLRSDNPTGGQDIISDDRHVYAVRGGERKLLLTIPNGYEMHNYQDVFVMGKGLSNPEQFEYGVIALNALTVNSNLRTQFQLYSVNLKDLTSMLIPAEGSFGSVQAWEKELNSTKFVFSVQVSEPEPQNQVMSYDPVSGELEMLYNSEDGVSYEPKINQNALVLDSPGRLLYWTETGWVQIAEDSDRKLRLQHVSNSNVIYQTGTGRFDWNSFGYSGKIRLYEFDTTYRKTHALLPDVEGDQYLIMNEPLGDQNFNETSFFVGNFVAGPKTEDDKYDGKKRQGKVQIWKVGNGKEPQLMFEKETTYGKAWLQPSWRAEKEIVLSTNPGNPDLLWAVEYDRKTGQFTERPPQVKKNEQQPPAKK